MPAGATPIPLSPNCTVTGPCTVAPSRGAMKYTSAPAAAVERSCASAIAASNDALSARNKRFIQISPVVMFRGTASQYHNTLEQILHAVAFLRQFAMCNGHFFAAEFIDVQTVDDAVFARLARYRIGIDHAFGDAVASVGRHGHADPITGRRALHPVMHVIQCG